MKIAQTGSYLINTTAEPKFNNPSQPPIDNRFTKKPAPTQYTIQQHPPTVYPDAVYLPNNPQSNRNQSVHFSHAQTRQTAQQSTLRPPQYPHNLPFNHQPHFPQGSYVTQSRPVHNPRTQIKQVKQVIYEQEPLNIPESVRNVQYVPQLNRYMDYVEERIKIPVEKYYTDYYEVEHVTDFVPREYEESVIEMVPEEIIRYRLEYVPVQRKIVHLPKNQVYDQNGLFKGIGNLADRVHIDDFSLRPPQGNKQPQENLSNSQKRGLDESLVNKIVKDIEAQGRTQNLLSNLTYQGESRNLNTYSNVPRHEILDQMSYDSGIKKAPSQKSRVSRKRSNFVTSDGYFPNYEEELRNMESSLSASRERYI